MTTAIDNFIEQIEGRSEFATAATLDPIWSKHLAAIEFALREIDRRANDDSAMVDVFDRVVALIGDNDRTLKQRLLDLIVLLAPLRDKLHGVRH